MVFLVILFHEISQDMSLKVIDHHHRYSERHAQSLRERCSYEQRAEKARTTCECYGSQFLRLNPGLFQSLTHYRNDVLLMSSGRQLRNDTAIIFVNLLTGNDIGQ